MTQRLKPLLLSLAAAGVFAALLAISAMSTVRAADDKKPAASKAALTVTVTQLQPANLPTLLAANGSIAPWQEAIVGTEANGLRLADVKVNVGDVVKRGQVLATFASDTIHADLAQTRAAVAEAEANAAEAAANAQRARDLQPTGALSAQQTNQYLTAERTAQARLEAQRAAAKVQQLRLQQAQVLAPDNGVISSRSATVGAVLPAGQELFRLIRGGRLEWRAEVPSSEIGPLKPGMAVRVLPASGEPVTGKLRIVAPTVDAQTRNGLVYVDLPNGSSAAKAGMFARGEFEIGSQQGMTLPQSAVLLREGFSYVLRVGADNKVTLVKVKVGQRIGERIQILGGVQPADRVVATGGGFLGDGDTVHVVDALPVPAAASAAATASR
jgi:RND family efflux transporter MFP subunit